MNWFPMQEATKQKLQIIFIVVMLIILAVEVKLIYDKLHPPTTAPADMVMVYQSEVNSQCLVLLPTPGTAA